MGEHFAPVTHECEQQYALYERQTKHLPANDDTSLHACYEQAVCSPNAFYRTLATRAEIDERRELDGTVFPYLPLAEAIWYQLY